MLLKGEMRYCVILKTINWDSIELRWYICVHAKNNKNLTALLCCVEGPKGARIDGSLRPKLESLKTSWCCFLSLKMERSARLDVSKCQSIPRRNVTIGDGICFRDIISSFGEKLLGLTNRKLRVLILTENLVASRVRHGSARQADAAYSTYKV